MVPGSIAPHIKAGTVRALATSGTKRTPTMPDVPTFESLGLGSVNPGNFRFLASPSAVPRAIQSRLVSAMEKLAQMPDLATRLADNGYDPTFLGPPASREYVAAEMQKWRKVMKESGMKVN